jgi:dihydrofolate reductase
MGTIKVHEFTTLDGVIDTPLWTMDYEFTDRLSEALGQVTGSCSAILLGRRTYEMFASAWPQRTVEDDPGAPFFNDSPKYVVSTTLTDPGWANSQVLGGYSAEAVRDLKDRVDGGIYVSGSGTLVRALLADGLVDELHLVTYPLAVGTGPRLFPDGGPRTVLSLAGCQDVGSGIAHLVYTPTGT